MATNCSSIDVTTIAGLAGVIGIGDGSGSVPLFNLPKGITIDSSGILYVADTFNHTIRKIDKAGNVTTIAGAAGSHGSTTNVNGSAARFYLPYGITIDSSGNLYVADTVNHTIRKIDTNNNYYVTTIAGSPRSSGSTTDVNGSAALFYGPEGITIDSLGNLYVADTGNHTIRKIDTTNANYYVTTIAGLAKSSGFTTNVNGSAARFNNPRGITIDSSGNLYVADSVNHTIRKIDTTNANYYVTTIAGSPGSFDSITDGIGSAARFNGPEGITIDSSGDLYVSSHQTIRKIDTTNANYYVTTIAGSPGSNGSTNGSDARFNNPRGITIDSFGNLYVADSTNHTIRKITCLCSAGTYAGGIRTCSACPAGTYNASTGSTSISACLPCAAGSSSAAGSSACRSITTDVYSDAQSIQSSEIDSAAGSSFVNQPAGNIRRSFPSNLTVIQQNIVDPSTLSGNWAVTPPDPTNGKYSFSIDIKLETTWNTVSGSTFPLFLHAGSPNFYINNGGAAPVDWWEVNGICMYQSTIGSSVVRPNENQQVYNQLLTPGSWINIIVVSDGIHVNTYVNGVLNSTITDAANRTNTSGIKWQTGAWTWGGLVNSNRNGVTVPTAGKCKIRDFYWWSNKALSTSEISGLQNRAMYTMSMDIKIQNTHTTWRNVISNGPDSDGGSAQRRPAVYVIGSNFQPANRIQIWHETTELTNHTVTTQFVAPLGQYFNLTWVVNETSLDTYINGVKDPSASISGSHFTWLESTWMTRNVGYPQGNGPIYIKNVYFWNRALTPLEVQFFGKSVPAPFPAGNPCAGISDSTLASSVPIACLQQTFKEQGCTNMATIPNSYQGWWNQSPQGSTLVWCDSTHTGTQCGAGTYGQTRENMAPWSKHPLTKFYGQCKLPVVDIRQTIQSTELEVGTSSFAFTTVPTVTSPPHYSMSMDINIAQVGASWRVILGSTDGGDWSVNRPATNTRRPVIGIHGNNTNNPPANRLYVNHTNANGDFQGQNTNFVATPGSWFNLTFTIDSTSKRGIIYINGVYDSQFFASDFAWSNPANWTWNNSTYGKYGSVKVRNVYFWNRVLGSSEVAPTCQGGDYKPDVLCTQCSLPTPGTLEYVTGMCGTVTVSTIAGDGTPGFSDTAPVQFFHPCGVAVDSAGNVYVGDKFNQRIRKITPGPGGTVTVSTLAGSGTAGFSNTAPVQFYYPLGVAVDSAGNVYVADSANDRIRKITPGGTVTTLAGDGTPGFSNTEPIRFNNPTGVAVDSAGNVYVADKFNHRIRKITPGGTVSTIAGSGTAGPGAGQLNNPGGVAVDSARNVYVADSGNHRIRKITPGGTVSTIAGSGTAGFSDIGWGQFNEPLDVAVDSAGNVYVADLGNNRIRKITPSGTVSTLNTAFNSPSGVAVDSAGDVYVADNANHRIRKFTPSLSDTQITARTSCPTANYVSNFSQGSWDSLGSTGTCTQCGVPVNPTDYVTQICGLTSNTVISSASCAGATFASNFTRGSWDQLGQYQCLACPANSSSSSNELMCTCDPGYYSAYATCIQDKLSWAPTNSWVFGKGNSSADGSLKVKNVYFFQTELSRPSVIRLYDSLTTGVTSCTFCPAHTYGNQLGSTTCSPCPVGTQFLGTGGQISTVCTSCTVSSTCGTCPSATPKWNGTTCVS